MTHMTCLHTDSYLIIHGGKCNAINHPLNGRFIMILLLTLHQMQQVQSNKGKRAMAVPLDSGSFWAISHQSKSDQLQLQSQRISPYSPWNCLSLYAKYYSYEFNPLNVKICQVNPQNPWFRIGCISVGVGLQVGYLPVGLIVDTVYSNYSWWIRKELRTGGKTLQCWSTFMFPIIILIE